MIGRRDLVVIGGGPAGVAAAVAAAGAGLRTVLVDERTRDGGNGDRVPAMLAPGMSSASPVESVFGHAVWSVSPGFRVDALGPDGPCSWTARAVIAATGADERVLPCPGWTEPGVVGLAEALARRDARGTRPNRRMLVAGCGPELFAVAARLLDAGGEVAAVIDLASPDEWAARLPALASRPDLLMHGMGWLLRVKRAGVPILWRHRLVRVERHPEGRRPEGLRAVVGPVDANRRPLPGRDRSFTVDGVAVGHGRTPSSAVTRLLRAEHLFDGSRGGWIARQDQDGRTSIPGLSVAGDAGGIAGAAAAALGGRLAGLAVALDLGTLTPEAHARLTRPLRPRAARARRFGDALAAMTALRPAEIEAIPRDAVVCRCEDVTRAAIDSAIEHGAVTANQLKAWTRCGMGTCQGRICGDIAGALLARGGRRPEDVGTFTGRTPLRPLSVDVLAGQCDYADIALPPAAPL